MSEKPGQEDYPPQPDNPVGSCKRSARWRAHHVFDGRPLRDPTSTCQLLLGRWIGLLGRRGPPRHGLPRLVLGQWGRSSQAPTWGESPSTQVERRLEVTFLRLVQRIRDAKTSSHGADLGFLRLVQRIRSSVSATGVKSGQGTSLSVEGGLLLSTDDAKVQGAGSAPPRLRGPRATRRWTTTPYV